MIGHEQQIMKKTFKVSKIEGEKVWAKEVNPLGEKPIESNPKYLVEVGHGSQPYHIDGLKFNSDFNLWIEAESQLKEYPLSEDTLINTCDSLRLLPWRLIGQSITGKLNEKGEIEI